MSKAPGWNKPKTPKVGDLCVWHNPQVGAVGNFYYPVASVEEAKTVLSLLAYYDLWQYDNNVKGDYVSAAGLSVYEGVPAGEEASSDGWYEWADEETGMDISELMREEQIEAEEN